MSDRDQYFTFGTAVLVVAGIFVAISAALYAGAVAEHRPYSLWANPAMFPTYGLVVVGVVLLIFGATGRALPPWKRTAFPDLEIDVEGHGFRRDAEDNLWLSFRLRITNRELERNASLTIRWRGRLVPGHLQRLNPRRLDWGETPFVAPSGEPPPDFPTEWLIFPLDVLPQRSRGGIYVTRVARDWADG
jgi:hypothetical protein